MDIARAPACAVCGDMRLLSDSDGVSLQDDIDQREYRSSPRQTLSAVYKAANSGCPMCSFLKEMSRFFRPAQGFNFNNAWLRIRYPIAGGSPEVYIADVDNTRNLQLYFPFGDQSSSSRVPVRSAITSDRSSPEALDWIKSCMKTCMDGHSLCKPPCSKLPNRVLYIGESPHEPIRVVLDTNQLIEPYMAFSYCWGQGTTKIKLTKQTLSALEVGFDVRELPQAFQEFISLSRNLGIRYVWIDALCIVQDDPEDWEKEASMMSQIYAEAILTVAASMSSSTSGSFLMKSPKDQNFSKTIELDGQDVELVARPIQQVGVHSKWTHWYFERHLYPREPWSQRGWTLQEQLLSSRLLIFTSDEMQWSCQGCQTCECQSPMNYRRLFGSGEVANFGSAPDAFYFWNKCVEDYSIRSLTRYTDRLPALSGIAQTIETRTGSAYIAGLWRNNIAECLLWQRVGEFKEVHTDYLAPSFSWASVIGEIDYRCFMNGKFPYQEVSEVLSCKASVQGHNPFGAVQDGEMIIRGKVTGVTLIQKKDGYAVALHNRVVQFSPDTMLAAFNAFSEEGSPITVSCRYYSRPSNSSVDQASHRLSQRPSVGVGAQCWLLRLGFYLPPHPSSKQSHQFMVLGKSPSQAGSFERLGLLVINDHPDSPTPITLAISSQEQTQKLRIV